MEKKKARAYKVRFENGIPVIPDSVYHSLISKGLTRGQIQNSLDVMSREMVKKGIKTLDQIDG